MADAQLGLTDYAKEMARWNQPYVYHEFPRMLFRGTTTTAGRVQVEQRIVASDRELEAAIRDGFRRDPQAATDEETRRQEAIGTAAAERASTERAMSAGAQAEAARADAAAGARHLGEIPERPRRPRPSRATPKKEPAS